MEQWFGVVVMEQNSEVFIDAVKNASVLSSTSVTAKPMKGVTDGVSFGSVGVTTEGNPLGLRLGIPSAVSLPACPK